MKFFPRLLAMLTAGGAILTGGHAYCQSPNPDKTMTDNQSKNTEVVIETTAGDITVRLYDDTPGHRDNFLKLASEGFYDGVLFHRVINRFMIQTGDPDSRNAQPGQMLGSGGPGYEIDAEFRTPERFHKRGVLAAARESDDTNPQKRSSGSQFYIVTGKVLNEGQLRAFERQKNLEVEQQVRNELMAQNRDTIMALRRARDFAALQQIQDEITMKTDELTAERKFRFTPEQREAYSTVGGTPFLDGEYTVFGEVVSGMDVVDKIQEAATDSFDRPVEDIRITGVKIVGKE